MPAGAPVSLIPVPLVHGVRSHWQSSGGCDTVTAPGAAALESGTCSQSATGCGAKSGHAHARTVLHAASGTVAAARTPRLIAKKKRYRWGCNDGEEEEERRSEEQR